MNNETQTWYYAVVTHNKDFPFTTSVSLDKEFVIRMASLFGTDYELRTIEIKKP